MTYSSLLTVLFLFTEIAYFSINVIPPAMFVLLLCSLEETQICF